MPTYSKDLLAKVQQMKALVQEVEGLISSEADMSEMSDGDVDKAAAGIIPTPPASRQIPGAEAEFLK